MLLTLLVFLLDNIVYRGHDCGFQPDQVVDRSLLSSRWEVYIDWIYLQTLRTLLFEGTDASVNDQIYKDPQCDSRWFSTRVCASLMRFPTIRVYLLISLMSSVAIYLIYFIFTSVNLIDKIIFQFHIKNYAKIMLYVKC